MDAERPAKPDDRWDRLDRVERELAVRRLIDQYAHGCDTDDAELVASLFDDDGVLTVRGVERTGDELVEFYRGRLSVPSLHFVSGLTLAERSDGLIDATCGFLALETPESGADAVLGCYVDMVRVDDGVARFVSREIVVNRRLSN